MRTVTVEQAEGHLQEFLDLAEQGEEVVIAGGKQSQFKLVPLEGAPQRRVFGQYQGKIEIADDFDAPLPDDFWLSGVP
jgi:antitoxin (DNA-binding transcriptional repressor) of toxin-antitoxin stability system